MKNYLLFLFSISTALTVVGQESSSDAPQRSAMLKENSRSSAENQNAPNAIYTDKDFGRNILKVTPFAAMPFLSLGAGLEYELVLDKDQRISLVLPISFLRQYAAPIITDIYANLNFVYFSPGLKFYPGGQRRVSYAAGPNLILGWGTGYKFDNRTDPVSSTRVGFVINNYLTIKPSKHFQFQLNLGPGIRFISTYKEQGAPTEHRNILPILQFGLSLGYRF